ncbi:MAG: RNB domain-containing ribonuclease [Burkholderiaceae bacterium]
MSYVLFEESGDFKAGTVLADNGTSLQVELTTGRRAKVKAGHVLMRFASPEPATLLETARTMAEDLDIDFLWECAPQREFGFAELATDYFGDTAQPVQAAAFLLRLQAAPVYFHRKGRGLFRPAPEDTLKAALAGIERRREQEARIEAHAQAMAAGDLPDEIRADAIALLVRPDKHSVSWRALEQATGLTRRSPERLLFELGAFGSARQLHRKRFVFEHFPGGEGFAPGFGELDTSMRARIEALPEAEAVAFSIDDSSTTEIDDALSVRRLDDGRMRVGIHIAAPAVAIERGSPLDAPARDRLSTVYMPGDKITMLPDPVIEAFSLDAGAHSPALSLYADLDDSGTRIVERHTVLERVHVADNLRHDHLDADVTEAALEDSAAPLPHGEALRVLWRLTNALSAGRDKVRGKPEPRFRTDFSFHVDGEDVRIVQRRRDAPLDRIVAEMMILANSEWGALLARNGIAGIYRAQQAGRVRMSTKPLAHDGIGVAQYMWSTSPLRRYVDLVNQRQLIALVEQTRPPYEGNDAELFSLLSAFDAKSTAYQSFQQRMERYWCLRWIEINGRQRLPAVTIRDDLVRLADAPLYFRMAGVPALAPGRRIVIELIGWDLVDLSVEARFIEVAGGALAEPDAPEMLALEAEGEGESLPPADGGG